jgi:methyltransferase-like protein/SAM-dependent methyltransferase
MTTQDELTSYDRVPYQSYPYPQTHPDRLATVATLLGLRPPRVTQCRVLELGCSSGGNLIPMALTLPDSSFVGIDLSRVEIGQGQKVVQDLGLRNIELKHLGILDVDRELGQFDYIICHGVYSWVPAPVQDKNLDICRDNLAANGIAYVSYNTYPGWHMRGLIRDMLLYHTEQFRESQVPVRQARNFLDFLGKAAARETTPFGLLLKMELEAFRRSSDSYLFHEHLEEVNEPIYFHQFAARAAAKGLRYVGETDIRSMVPANYPPEIESVLQVLAQDHVHMEQYMDFIRNNMFRQSLLCHAQHQPSYSLSPVLLRNFLLASAARPKSAQPNLGSTEPEMFESPGGVGLAGRDPIVKATMLCLADLWPRALPFAELCRQARSRLTGGPTDHEPSNHDMELARTLLQCYASAPGDLLELHVFQPPFVTEVSARPRASALARYQAASGSRITNLRHESLALGDAERHILARLDGTKDRKGLSEVLERMVARGELTMGDGQETASDAPTLKQSLPEVLDRQLLQFAKNALLVA